MRGDGQTNIDVLSSVYMVTSFRNHHELAASSRPSVVAFPQGLSSYVYNSLRFSVTQDIAEVGYQLCLSKQRDLQLRLLVLSMHPGMDTPVDPAAPCTYPSSAGEAIIIATCASEKVRISQNSTCFEDVPVVPSDGRDAFMRLPSMKIVPSSGVVACGSRTTPLVEERGVWYSSHQMVEPRKAPPFPVAQRT